MAGQTPLAIFFKLPRLTVLAVLVVVMGGIGALASLGRQEDPTLVERFGSVLVTLPGADAESMEALITQPLEAAIMELPEVDEMNSLARNGVVQLTISVREDLSEAQVDDAWTLIRQKVEQARASFPPGTRNPVVERQFVGASTLIVAATWTGEGDPPLAVMRRMALNLQDRFQRLAGTELSATFGLPVEEVRVVVDSEALSSAGLSFSQAAALIAAADSKSPAGRMRAENGNIGVEVGGEFTDTSRISDVPLLQRADGSAVRVGDVASVTKGFEDPVSRMATRDGKRTILISANISPGQRVDQWAARARAEVAAFSADPLPGFDIEIVFDQSEYTTSRLSGLAANLATSALIVFGVLFFTMGWRSAIVVGTAIPLTICLVLILFNVFGHPLHQMSVTGLVISLGLLIDNAIVVADDIDQWRARGLGRIEAIERSLGHLLAPLAASTLTTALAFAPIALLPGSAGEFVGMIGVSVVYSIVASFAVSVTVIPAMMGWFDRQRSWERDGVKRPRRWWRDGVAIDILSDGYRASVEAVLRFPPLGILICVVPACLGLWAVTQLPQQFFPPTERDQFQVVVNLPTEATLAETAAITARAGELMRAKPGVRSVTWVAGEPAPRVYYNAINNTRGLEGFASGWVQLDGSQRTREVIFDIQRDLRREFPSARFLALPFEQGPPAAAPIEIFIRGNELGELNRLGDEIRTILNTTPGVTYTTASLELGAPTLRLDADETASALTGVRLTDLAAGLNAELEGIRAGSILEGTEELPVRVIASAARRASLSELRSKTFGAGPDSMGAPLSALGDVELVPATSVISRQDGERTNQILAYLDPYTLPAPSLAIFKERLAESGFALPPGYSILQGGEAENSGDAVGDLMGVGIPLILVMAGAIMLVFNSFRMMLLVMTTGLLSVFYAFIGVWLFNLPFGFNAILGSLGLFGIAINGTIVVLSLLRANADAMADDVIAQREVVVDATRHIVATTLTTMGGFIPILLSGDAFWLPLAAGIAGGVAGSAILAVYFTPAVFRLTTLKPVRRSLRAMFGTPVEPAE